VSEDLDKDLPTADQPKKVEIELTPPPKPKPKRRTGLAWLITLFVLSLAINGLAVWYIVGNSQPSGESGAAAMMPRLRKAGPAPGVVEASKSLVEMTSANLRAAKGACNEGDYRTARDAAQRAYDLSVVQGKLGVPPAKDEKVVDPAALKGIVEELANRSYTSAESELGALLGEEAPAKADAKAAEPADAAKEPADTTDQGTNEKKPAEPEAAKPDQKP
jgi:hypothetical protein